MSQDAPESAETLLILGADGDLTARLLLPGLGGLVASGAVGDPLLIGAGMEELTDAGWRKRVTASFAEAGAEGKGVDRVVSATRYMRVDVTDAEQLSGLLADCQAPLVIYFALPPAVTQKACGVLAELDLPAGTRLAMEKPFGTDVSSARSLNELVTRLVPEDHVHRVDHFLGMSTVLNIVGLRFANRIFEPLMSSQHVAAVDVVFDETLGLEGRAGYYDGAGALIDMLQSHLLQVLSLVAMEAPPTLSAQDLRDRRAEVLRATRIRDDDPVASSRRARYTAGSVDGEELPAYADEEGVDPKRKTETLAEMVVAVDTWRWAGVPFRLRSGKAIGNPRQEVTIIFKDPPVLPQGFSGCEQPDRLRIGIAPGAGELRLEININGPGDPAALDSVDLTASFGAGELPEYGEVLKGVLTGDPTLSVRGDMAEQCWRIVEPVLRAWRSDEVPLDEYEAGSAGPSEWK